MLDNHFKIWHAYANAYWPRKYIVLNGKIYFDHIGEGGYHETELMIRQLLNHVNPELDLSSIPVDGDPQAICSMPTPETYCGYSRGYTNNPGDLRAMEDFTYEDPQPGRYDKPGIYLQGRWRADRQYLEHSGMNPEDYLVLPIEAVSVNLVMTSANGPLSFDVNFNDEPLNDANRGNDVSGSTATIVEPRMYNLFRADEFVTGTLKLTNLPPGIRLYAFSFGGCIGIP
ncbi:MAG TPA: hypothetical protein VGK02_01200 [Candidatus Aquicultor sp.]